MHILSSQNTASNLSPLTDGKRFTCLRMSDPVQTQMSSEMVKHSCIVSEDSAGFVKQTKYTFCYSCVLRECLYRHHKCRCPRHVNLVHQKRHCNPSPDSRLAATQTISWKRQPNMGPLILTQTSSKSLLAKSHASKSSVAAGDSDTSIDAIASCSAAGSTIVAIHSTSAIGNTVTITITGDIVHPT